MTSITESEALAFLQSINGIYGAGIKKLKKEFGSFISAATAFEHEYLGIISNESIMNLIKEREEKGIQSTIARLKESNIHFVSQCDALFPEKLKNIPDPPFGLYYMGSLPDSTAPSVAIIGARNCSGYGRQMAREFAREIALSGIQIISGLARGIDGISQESALSVNGYTCGILGSGVDVCYPRENEEIYERCKLHGGIISEYAPGTPPNSIFFPARNRIIAGLSDSVIVIEAREHSGTLITVNMALEQGKDVYALPGRVTESLSYGCNLLIRDGATPLLRPHEFVSEFYSRFGIKRLVNADCDNSNSSITNSSCIHSADRFLSETERQIISILDYYPKTISEIYIELQDIVQMELTDLMELLTSMVMRHKIKCVDACNYYLE